MALLLSKSQTSHPSSCQVKVFSLGDYGELLQGHWNNKFENHWQYHCQHSVWKHFLYPNQGHINEAKKSKNKTYFVGDSINWSENKLMRGCGLIFHWSESLLCETCLVTFDVSAKWLFLKLPWPLFMRVLVITQWLMKLVSSWWSLEIEHDPFYNSILSRSLTFSHPVLTRLGSDLKTLLIALKREHFLKETFLDMQKPQFQLSTSDTSIILTLSLCCN